MYDDVDTVAMLLFDPTRNATGKSSWTSGGGGWNRSSHYQTFNPD